jgi:NAD-dependent dihydropyrimidine dehydrogenase PreA subunit
MSVLPEKGCKQAPGKFKPVVTLERCEGKGDCVRVCPEDVFALGRIDASDYREMTLLLRLKLRVHGMKVASTPNAAACLACGLCVAACPEKALSLARVLDPS